MTEFAGRTSSDPVARLKDVSLIYGKVRAVDGVTLDIPAGRMVGLIGPDGVGKSSLLSLITGARAIQQGTVEVLGGSMARALHRRDVCPRIAYMPQGLGKNLYPTLSVSENLAFFGRLFGQGRAERERRIADLTQSTGLAPFVDRPAGKLSGGMKQKLGLCCALIHDPDLLVLDEPTTGVDPLSRRQFWELIDRIREGQPGMSVIVATAYMEEAARFDWLVAMDEGRVLATGTPRELLRRTETETLEEAFIALMPEEKRRAHKAVVIAPREEGQVEIAIEAKDLTMRFGDFVAVDHVSFEIPRGEIFGFLGSNGCGKTTTMKMLTGLLEPSEGEAFLFGQRVDARDIETRRRVGYMSQAFSLYTELTVRQNLELHARLFEVPEDLVPGRVEMMSTRFGLTDVLDVLPDKLPLGQRQRLSLAVAMIHQPAMLILDEPTSGVDPIARDAFWQIMIDLARDDKVTIFISTHFMNEAERCDRISLMHAGRVLVSDTPAGLVRRRGVATLEDAFIGYLEDAGAEGQKSEAAPKQEVLQRTPAAEAGKGEVGRSRERAKGRYFNPRRMFSYTILEALELRRDPIRAILALVGSIILMFIMGYGISMDVEDLTFAVLDRDQSPESRDYVLNLAGSRYFIEKEPIVDYADLDRRMRSGEITLAIEIPPGFGRDIARGRKPEVGAWIDGAMPSRGETISGYVQGMHNQWLAARTGASSLANIEIRYRYNPDVESLKAMVPAVIPLLLLMIPAMLAALSVVREKELGSIVNLYVTPVTKLEFLLGKQIPYVGIAMLNFLSMTALAVTVFGVPITGSYAALALGAFFFTFSSTAMGLLMSCFLRSQIAAIFGTAIATMIPATQYSGMLDPVSSLAGAGALIGTIYPATYFLTISRGIFSKSLEFSDLQSSYIPLLIAMPVLIGISAMLLRKQET